MVRVEASDMILVPDSTTAFIDPFLQHKTLGLICTVHEPVTREAYVRCLRALAQRAMSYIQGLSYADTAYFGPEAEFFMFDQARFGSRTEGAFYEIDSAEGSWNTGADKCSPDGYQISAQGGYLPVLPFDRGINIRQTMVKVMMELGLHVEREHHEVATAGQSEISLRYDTLLRMADQMMLYKYVARNVAVQNGKTVTFMPKPLYDANGSGMHVHVSF
jgi:glutamine synthetase